MKKSLLIIALVVAASGFVLAHGPPSIVDVRSMAIERTASNLPMIGGGLATVVSVSHGTAFHGGGSGGITTATPAKQTVPPDERMLN